ncbi:hypothetical protein PVNG_05439 [Plasmodium vivax North Korean]|uniref:Uncharacterized protein n=1 Tax=Plasmodium vivax North Korean TaxID=1035514 RepID=A0A0J9TM67_PLAVI|nr:hypothetical protein PVNG_05439 [Plasmodium vivax North Korean]
MLNPAIEDLVINYDDYSTITKIFKEKNDYDYSDKYDVVFKYAQREENWNEQKFKTTYDQIFRHLKNSSVMLYYMQQGCKYMSYFLHKHVTNDLHHYYDSDSFKILHKYVTYFHKYEGSTSNMLCLPHIVYVNYDMYKELNTIYELYNLYNNLLPMNSQWEDSKCLSLKSFINQYNYYIKKIDPTNLKLKEILKPFENNVRKTINGLDGKCTNYTYPLENLEQPKPPEENKQQRTQELAQPQPQALQHQEENQRGGTSTEETQLTLTLSLPSSPELGSVTTESGIEQGVETDLRSGRGPEPVIKEVTVSELQESHDYITPRTHTRNERIGQSQYRLRVESAEPLELTDDRSFLPQHGLEGDQETMGKITGAIIGVLREVEPGPILGVSGGMGALFLLFKVFIALKIYLYVNNTFM